VKVDVQVQSRAEPLDCRDGATAPLPDASTLGSAALERQQRADEDAEYGAAEAVVPGEGVAEAVRQGENPLPDRQTAENVVNEVSCQVGHAPAAARWTEPPPLARKRDQDLVPAAVAAESGEAARHGAAGEKLPKLPLDEGGQALAAVACPRLLEEGLELLAEHAMEDAVLRAPAHVRAQSAIAAAVDPLGGFEPARLHVAGS
jgi:hypothetical protein